MADRQLELWINERWYDALSEQLKKDYCAQIQAEDVAQLSGQTMG